MTVAASGGARPWPNKAGRVKNGPTSPAESKRYRAGRCRVCRCRYRCLAVQVDAICSRCGGVFLEEGVDGGLGVYEGLDCSVVVLLQFRSRHFGVDAVIAPYGDGAKEAKLVQLGVEVALGYVES